MVYKRIYLDSNIFIRAFESAEEDPVASQLASLFAAGAHSSGPAFVTSQITLAETLVHPIRAGNNLLRLQYEQLLSVTSIWLTVAPVSRQALVLSAQLRAKKRLKLPDALHLAGAVMTGCSHFLSRDEDFKFEHEELPVVIRPTEDILESLLAWLRS